MNLKTNLALFFLIILNNVVSAQDPLKIASDLYKSFDQLKEAYDDASSVREIVKQIEEGKKPSVADNKWTLLADKYSNSAKSIKSAQLPTQFDQSKYKISIDQIKCDKLPELIETGTNYLQALKDAKLRGIDALSKLDAAIILGDSTVTTLQYLIKVHDKLIRVPIYNEIFQWDWFILNTSVSSSLGEFRLALNAQKRILENELHKLNVFIPNLESNLSHITNIKCIKDGVYISNDEIHRFKLEIKGSSCIWTEKSATGLELTQTVSLTKSASEYKIMRPNDLRVLMFLGYQSSIRTEILSNEPQASFMMISPLADNLVGLWYGLLVIKDSNAHLKELKQPSKVPPKTFTLIRQ